MEKQLKATLVKNKSKYSVVLYYRRVRIHIGISLIERAHINLEQQNPTLDNNHKNYTQDQKKLNNAIFFYNYIIDQPGVDNMNKKELETYFKIHKNNFKLYNSDKNFDISKLFIPKNEPIQNKIDKLLGLNQKPIDYYCEDWIETLKTGELSKTTGKPLKPKTISSYKRIWDCLKIYQEKKGQLLFEELDYKKMDDIHQFFKKTLQSPRINKDGTLTSRKIGGFSPSMLSDFNVLLKMYLKYVEEYHDIEIHHKVKKYSARHTKNPETIIVMEREQFIDIHNFIPKNKAEQDKKDIIVFMLHTGVAVADLANITRHSFTYIQETDTYILKGNRQKNGNKFEVPLNEIALEILKRKNFKEKNGWIFTRTKMYRKGISGKPNPKQEPIEEKLNSKDLSQYCRTVWNKIPSFDKEVKVEEFNEEGDDTHIVLKPLKKVYSLHCNRATFCSILIKNNVNHHSILSYMGWERYRNIEIYLERFGDDTTQHTDILVNYLEPNFKK